jgi:hypothetical protein
VGHASRWWEVTARPMCAEPGSPVRRIILLVLKLLHLPWSDSI